MTLRPAIFLDRDGVLIAPIVREGKPYAAASPDQVRMMDGVTKACRELSDLGYLLVMTTNQPDVARGKIHRTFVEDTNAALARELALDGIEVCMHDNQDACPCRKPLPGLMLQAARKLPIDLSRSIVVGDRWRDIEAGRNAGCRTVLIDYHYDEVLRSQPDHTAPSLQAAVDWIKAQIIGNYMELKVKIFADGADKADILRLYADKRIQGFTTNPTLMRKAGITDYEAFAKDILASIKDRPISFEVFSDDFAEMERQALKIAEWGSNVYVKIPVTNSEGRPAYDLIHRLALRNVQLNVTAIMTMKQVREVSLALEDHAPANVSIFAGRIADTGVDPLPLMSAAVAMCASYPNQEIIWASPRELLNIFQADQIGCQIITVTPDVLKKLSLVGKDLTEYSLETVQMFSKDAEAAGFTL